MAIVETILGTVLGVVLDKLASKQVVDFLKSSKLDHSLVDQLKDLMLLAAKVLADAEHKQITDDSVKSWLIELRHLFYRSEEIVDELATQALKSSSHLTQKSPEPKSFTGKVRSLIPAFSNSSLSVKKLNSDLKEVVTRLDTMVSHTGVLGLTEDSASEASRRVETSSILEDPQVFGREKEKQQLLKLLSSEDAKTKVLSVVVIVGMGGMGKTTLAQMVYNDDSLGPFEIKAWVHVSDQFDICRVTKSILESITGNQYSDSPTLNFLQNELSKQLKEKMYLLVLDDVWNEKYDDWSHLIAPLNVGAYGSKVIVTTRKDGVSSIMSTTPVIRLNSLPDDDGWLLFSKHAFGNGNLSSNPKIEILGRKILDKCSGLPLAIKSLGGILRSKEDIKEWEAVLESSIWDLPAEKSNIVPALMLSYDYLPGHLKRCFSYCAIFPKGYSFDPKTLVLLWMAENFVKPTKNERRIEDIGDEYFSQLSSCSFFSKLGDDVVMHDLIHDLAEVVSGDFFVRLDDQAGIVSNNSEKARFFSYNQKLFEGLTKFECLYAAKYLRTFFPLKNEYCKPCYLTNKILAAIIPSFCCLRVLSLSNYRLLKLPESVEHLQQLRYLDVSDTDIIELPESVCTMNNLQTLLLSGCRNLERLPTNMSNLVFLRHLDLNGTPSLKQMPKEMRKLKCLQTLTSFVVSKGGGAGLEELRELQHIRGKLVLRHLENVSSPYDALHSILSSRDDIDELALEFEDKRNVDFVNGRALLESLRPNANLKRLTIRNYPRRSFPSWLNRECSTYYNIVELHLIDCNYRFLPPFGQLPSLRVLEIVGMDLIRTVGSEFYGYESGLSDPFNVLKILGLKRMRNLEVWSGHEIMEGRGLPFKCLESLTLYNCPQLKGQLPVNLHKLTKLEIWGCEKVEISIAQQQAQAPSIYCSEQPLSPEEALGSCSFHLASLTTLKLHGLQQLVSLPPEVSKLSCLETLSIGDADNLKSLKHTKFPPNLRNLDISNCEHLESLPEAMVLMICLQTLSITNCPCIKSLKNTRLPPNLRTLWIGSCENLDSLPEAMVLMTRLKEITIVGCPCLIMSASLSISMERMHEYSALDHIHLSNIGGFFENFDLGGFPRLRVLKIYNCKDLVTLHISQGTDLIHLTSLTIIDCPKLKSIGTKEVGVVDLPAPNLQYLEILGCENVKLLTGNREGLALNKLVSLRFYCSDNITPHRNARSLLMFSCLRVLELRGNHADCFPEQDSLPNSITSLKLVDFPNLKLLNGEALKNLTCIVELNIWNCRNLKCLPREGLPASLGSLNILGCRLLNKRCKRDNGLDWPKVQNIPSVIIDCGDI